VNATPAAVTAPIAMPSWRVSAAALLMVLNAAISGLLLLQHHGVGGAVSAVNQVCGSGTDSGCETVARSPYAEVRGIPLAAVGLAFSTALAVALLLGAAAGPDARAGAARIALGLLLLALVADLYLLGVQAFAIKAFCRLCLLTYALNALAFFLLLPARTQAHAFRTSLGAAPGRTAVAGALVAALALTAAAWAASKALRYRERAHAGAILGIPSSAGPVAVIPAPTLSPATPGTEAARWQEEARVAQEQARRLQEILDDPRKLDEYMTQKAQRDYEQAPVQTFNLKTTPYKGPQDAPIRVVEFSDFLCPFCRQLAGAFAAYIPQSANRVVLYYKNYPLDPACNPAIKGAGHAGACSLALGAICAQEQGKFWPYHDRVFSSPPANPQTADVVNIAREAGLDAGAMESCLQSSGTRQRLSAEIAEAGQSKVDSTPTLFINGKKLPRLNDFLQTVEREASRMGLPPLPPPGAAAH
jgi:serine/threonine-protein kinase